MTARHLVAAIAAASMMAAGCSSGTDSAAVETAASATPESTAEIVRGSLSSEREFNARVSFGDTWSLQTQASGIVTRRHEVGTIVQPGDELLRVDEHPVYLALGVMPMFRELHLVDTRQRDQNNERLELLEGYDVVQLQQFLIDAGHDDDGEMTTTAIFDQATEDALEAWQASVGLPVTGRIDSSTIVFQPEPLRIASAQRIGEPVGELTVSAAKATVLVDTSNRDRSALEVGSDVAIDIADQAQLRGTVVKQEQVTGADGQRVWRSTIEVAADELTAEGSATVTATETVASDVLIAPVGALIALAEGGYAVEVAEVGLTRVSVGEVLQGRAEISGDIEAGTDVVVPT